jgi:electron transport complex protein RnfG
MAKKESTFVNMVVTLLVITGVASLALSGVYEVTKEPIAKAKQEKKERAIKEVIPEFTSMKSMMTLPSDGKDSIELISGYRDSLYIGTAVSSYTNKGYSGLIKVMVGFLPDGCIENVAVLEQKETPGLGTKITGDKFKDQFIGKDPALFKLKVKKDGGEVDAITAATISSRAFCDALQRAYDVFKSEGGDK